MLNYYSSTVFGTKTAALFNLQQNFCQEKQTHLQFHHLAIHVTYDV